MKWKKYLCSAVIFGVAVVLMAGPVPAQEDEYVLEDTVVTATKTGETLLQETPIAVTVFDDQMLGDRSTFDLQDLSAFVASADLTTLGFRAGMQGSIRGIGTVEPFFSGDTAIAFYLDGVFLFEGIGANPDFLDVERIEILRGPQGVTWGGNATGGAVNIITKKPSDELELEMAVEVGNYSKRRVDAMISGPVIKGKMNGRLAVSDSRHDGYIDNIQSEIDLAEQNYTAFRGSVQILPTDNVEILLKGHYYQYKGASDYAYKLLYWDSDTGGFADWLGYSKEHVIPSDFYTVNHDTDSHTDGKIYGGSAEITIDLPHDMTLVSLTGYYYLSGTTALEEVDYTAVYEVKLDQWIPLQDSDSWSQEVRLTGSWGRLDWLLGGNYIDQWGHDDVYWAPPTFFLPWGESYRVEAVHKIERMGIFANLTYAFTDKLSVTTGVRYSDESKEGDFLLQGYEPLPGGEKNVLFETNPKPYASWTDWTPRFVLDYKATQDLFLYAKAENGWRSGDIQPDNYWFNEEGGRPVNPEEIWLYEIGAKSDWFDKRLRVNAAVFKMDYDEMVIQNTLPNWLVLIENVGSLEIKGFELEVLARPTQRLTLNGSVTYLDSEYDSFETTNIRTGEFEDVAGNTVENVPEWKFVIGANYVVPFEGLGFLTFGTNIAYRGESHWTLFESDPRAWVDDYTLVNVLVRYETEDGRWLLEAYGRNLFEKEYYRHIKIPALTQDTYGRAGNPMTMGMRVSYRY